MRILEVSRYKENFADHQLPFVTEQGEAIRALGHDVGYFLVRGNYLAAVKALKAKIREFKPDVVHAHFGLSAITAELQSLVPVVTTFHNGETLNWHVNLMSSLMSLRAKHVIYVAQHIRDLSYFKAPNYSIIPCGVPMEQMTIIPKDEARKELGWENDKKYILFGGAFDNKRKNYALLRSAVELLAETKTQINTVPEINIEKQGNQKRGDTACCGQHGLSVSAQSAIVSELPSQPNHIPSDSASANAVSSPYKNTSDISSDSQKMPKTISSDADILKWTKVEGGEQFGDIVCIEMRGLSRAECVLRMCACDLFALPSHSEGSPQALKEAMAVNCPCLATDISDVRYLFGDEPGHWILRNPRKTHERWDGDERSLDEMVELLKEGLMFEGRTHGRERILELGLSNEQVAKRLLEIYKHVLSE